MSQIWEEAEEIIEKKKQEYKGDKLAENYPSSLANAIQNDFNSIPGKPLKQGDIKSYVVRLSPNEPEISSIIYELGEIDAKKLGEIIMAMGDLGYEPRGFDSAFGLNFTFSKDGKEAIEMTEPSFRKEGSHYKKRLYLQVYEKEAAKNMEKAVESVGLRVRD